MANVKLVEEKDASPKVKEIYEDIMKVFNIPFTPNLFKAMANHPEYLETTWNRFKVIMGKGKLDPKTKQVIALAVSAPTIVSIVSMPIPRFSSRWDTETRRSSS